MAIELLALQDGTNAGENQVLNTTVYADTATPRVGFVSLVGGGSLQTGDVILLVHSAEGNSNDSMLAPVSGGHPAGYSVASSALSGASGTAHTWYDFGYGRGGDNGGSPKRRQIIGAWGCVVQSGNLTGNIQVTLTVDMTPDDGVREAQLRLMVLRGTDTTDFSDLAAVARSSAMEVLELDYVEWEKPTNTTTYNSTTFSGDFVSMFLCSFRHKNGFDGSENSAPATHTRFVTTNPGTNGATWNPFPGTATTSTAGGYELAGAEQSEAIYFDTYTSFSAFDGDYPYTLDKEGTGDHNGGASVSLLFQVAAAGGIAVTLASSTVGT